MPIITLSSDIGEHDYLIGAIKGQLLSINLSVNIVDITHYLSSLNYPKVAYVCKNAFQHFPENTFHIILVDVFDNKNNKLLIAKWNKQWIACADNGILTMIAKQKPTTIYELVMPNDFSLLMMTNKLAETIHFILEEKEPETFLQPAINIEEKYPLKATLGNDWMEGQILFIDHFENIIVNITKEEFETHRKGRVFKISFQRDEVISNMSDNYSGVQEGEKVAFFNSAGYLEIAVNKGNMAGLFGLQGFNAKMNKQQNSSSQNKWFYQTVKIFFE
jgi:S-adenosylmethionine hydrolase